MTEHSVTEFYQVDEPQFRRTVHSQSKNYEQVGIGQNEGNRKKKKLKRSSTSQKRKKRRRRRHSVTSRKHFNVCYSGFRRKSASKLLMQAFLGHLKGDHDPDVPTVDRGNWGRERVTVLRARSSCTAYCTEWRKFWKDSRFIYVHFTYKHVDHFRNGSVHELYYLRTFQLSKVHAQLVLTR